MSDRQPRFEVVRTSAGWHTRLIATNGQIVLTSEVYTRKRAAFRAIAGTRLAFVDAGPTRTEIRNVDERYVPPPVVLEPPFYQRLVTPILNIGTREARYGDPETFWHDHDYHYRNCTDDCTEGTPPRGVKVRGRTGTVEFTAEHERTTS